MSPLQRDTIFGGLKCGAARRHFPQHRIDHARRRTFLRALHQFHGFMHDGMRRHAVEKRELVGAHAQGGEYLEVELCDAGGSQPGDRRIQKRPPAQHAHGDFGGQVEVRLRKAGGPRGMKQFVGVGGFAIHAHQYPKSGGAGGRDGHPLSPAVRLAPGGSRG